MSTSSLDHHIQYSSFATTNRFLILNLWARKGEFSHRFFRYQLIITQFQNLKIIWTQGKNLAFPDILSRNLTIEDVNTQQQKHKHIPRHIKFYDPQGKEIRYFIDHDTPSDGNAKDFLQIVCHRNIETTTLNLKNNETDISVTPYRKKECIQSLR